MADKNPWLAAVLNFFVWGLGYLYVGKGKRAMFAIGLVVTSVLITGLYYTVELPILDKLSIPEKTLLDIYYLLISGIIGLVFAWDAFKDAKEA